MVTDYQVVDSPSKFGRREPFEFRAKGGQPLLPLLDLVTQGKRAIDEVIDATGPGNDLSDSQDERRRSGRASPASEGDRSAAVSVCRSDINHSLSTAGKGSSLRTIRSDVRR